MIRCGHDETEDNRKPRQDARRKDGLGCVGAPFGANGVAFSQGPCRTLQAE